MGVRSHDDSGKACRDTPAVVAVDDAGHIVGPAVVIEAYGRRCLSSSWRANRQQFSSIANPRRNSRYLCSHMASLRPRTPLSSGSLLLGQSRSAGHSVDSGAGGRGTVSRSGLIISFLYLPSSSTYPPYVITFVIAFSPLSSPFVISFVHYSLLGPVS